MEHCIDENKQEVEVEGLEATVVDFFMELLMKKSEPDDWINKDGTIKEEDMMIVPIELYIPKKLEDMFKLLENISTDDKEGVDDVQKKIMSHLVLMAIRYASMKSVSADSIAEFVKNHSDKLFSKEG